MPAFARYERFLIATVRPAQIAAANEMRRERDARFGNVFTVKDSDQRWVGDLGEIVMAEWLEFRRGPEFTWVRDDAAGQPDIILPKAVRVGVKTVKRKGGMRGGYTAQISRQHAHEPVDHFWFQSYEYPMERMWLLGGIDKASFLAKAELYEGGQAVHQHYVIRPGHAIYNIDIGHLTPPEQWLDAVWPVDVGR